MGMTIDKCMDELQKLKLPISNHDLSFHFVEHARNETLDMAVDTMRKYQKIQEIMNELNGNFYGSYLKDRQALEKIYEVVEDGNDQRDIQK